MRMRKKILLILITVNIVVAFSGCGKKVEQQLALRDQGIVEMDNGNYDEAIGLFNQALAVSIGKVTELEIDIDYYKALAQYKAGYYEDAIKTYSALIYYDDNNFEPYYLRGCVYASNSEISKACEDYDRAIQCDKKNYELYIKIYENLDSRGFVNEGLSYMNRVISAEDKSANATYYKGRAHYMIGQWSEAEPLLKTAVEKNVNEAKLYLAKLYQDESLTEQAKSLLDEYAASDDVNSEAMAALGDIEFAKGNYESAYSYYQTGLNLEVVDNYPELYKGAVASLEYQGKFDEAKEVLTQYLDMYPDDEKAQNELIFIKTR